MARARQGGAEPESAAPNRERPAIWWAFEWAAVVVVALVLAIVVRTFVIQTFYIPSGSMEPTLDIGNRILVLKLAYDFTSPATGDVIVFKAPKAEDCGDPSVTDLVKRIIAVPGETVWSEGNTIFLKTQNGRPQALAQDWPHHDELVQPINRQLIPANHYFVMGDNHPASCDSRMWGTVPRSDIIGKVVLKIWPLSSFGTI